MDWNRRHYTTKELVSDAIPTRVSDVIHHTQSQDQFELGRNTHTDMTKTKTARLSLTMPGSIDSGGDFARASESQVSSKTTLTTGLRRPDIKSNHKKVPADSYEQDPVSSRSISPAAPFSAASEQSRSPNSPTSPTFTSLPQYPPSPNSQATHSRDHSQSRSLFQNMKASKSSVKIQQTDTTIRKVQQDLGSEESGRGAFKNKLTPDLHGIAASEPVPDIPRLDRDRASSNSISSGASSHTIPRRPVPNSMSIPRSNLSSGDTSIPHSPVSESHEARKNGKLFPNFMKRNHTGRPDDTSYSSKSNAPANNRNPEAPYQKPLSRDHSASRNGEGDDNDINDRQGLREGPRAQLKDQRSQSFKDGPGSNLFKGFKSHTAKAAKDIGKAGKGFFRNRHTSNSQAPPDTSLYELKILNQPLKEQTRITRIAKRLEDSKDKTEFWMPALPWRCIDFLNFTGCETEGLYRVPGSEREVRMWKARFDQEYDIDLFQEEELYDVNTVGSLFKSWLRELPEDVFPQSIQEKLSAKYSGEDKAPEEVKDVLSQLPPWNYYLLFAITCHLSLLHAYQEKNKMTFHNLFVCFAPALRLNGDCFRWLVGDWRSCWKGCNTEKETLELEYRIMEGDYHGPDPSWAQDLENDRGRTSAGGSESTPKAGTFPSSVQAPPQPPPDLRVSQASDPPQYKPMDTFQYKPSEKTQYMPSNYSQHSRDSSRHTSSSRESNDRELGGSRHLTASNVQSRKASQLPELDFPKPISPTFTTDQ